MTLYDRDLVARLSADMDEPAWLAERRGAAFERFGSLPWPDQSAEEWRHTDIRGLDVEGFDPNVAAPWSSEVPAQDGLLYRPLPLAAREHEELVRTWLGQAGVSAHEEKIHSFNAAFGIGVFVHVAAGTQVERPIVTTHQMAPGAAVLPRTVIVAEEGASLTFIHRYQGGEGEGLAVPVVEIYAQPGAQVTYLSVQDWPQTVWHFNVQRAVIERDATVRSLAATLGGGLSRSVAESLLEGAGAHSEMLGVYFGDHGQHIDNRSLQDHRAPDTTSDLYYKGALKGTSRAVYSGLVHIGKGARGSDAQQANRNLLLSPGAAADPKPFLEIENNEVRCTHGVSVGRPDQNVLFYLGSRGLNAAEAERLFVKGFFQEVLDRVRVPEVREALEAAVQEELEMAEDA